MKNFNLELHYDKKPAIPKINNLVRMMSDKKNNNEKKKA